MVSLFTEGRLSHLIWRLREELPNFIHQTIELDCDGSLKLVILQGDFSLAYSPFVDHENHPGDLKI